MKKEQFCCGAIFVAMLLALFYSRGPQAQSEVSLPEEYMRTLALRYEATVGDPTVFPDGCNNPYKDMNDFTQFFESAIVEIVVDQGAAAKGVGDLFAVSEMRSDMREAFPNLSEENPVDRLIASQLCQFQKFNLQKSPPGKVRPDPITSGNRELHKHLLLVGPKLYKDSRKIVMESLAQQAKLKDRVNRLAARRLEIRKARKMGRELVGDLFSSDQH